MIAENGIDALKGWLAKAGLRGEPEAALVNGFCERAVAAGLPISRAQLLIEAVDDLAGTLEIRDRIAAGRRVKDLAARVAESVVEGNNA